MKTLAPLTDAELLIEAQRLAANERLATAALVRCLIEVEDRGLHLGMGHGSMFAYCTETLRLSEGAAYNRIECARAARDYPVILTRLEDGSLTLTAVRRLAPHLTADNHLETLDAATHKTKRQIEVLIASIAPKPDAPTVVRRLPQPATPTACLTPAPPLLRPHPTTSPTPKVAAAVDAVPRAAAAPAASSSAPLSPTRYKLQVTISDATHDKLRRLQDLMRHSVPSGDVAEILDRALSLLLDDVARTRCAEVTTPRQSAAVAAQGRHIPAAVKRAVWKRDGGRCAFVGSHGRCSARAFLQYHHVRPFAAGGEATVENIELRCQAHNLYEWDLFSGCDTVRERANLRSFESCASDGSASLPLGAPTFARLKSCASYGWQAGLVPERVR